MFINTSIYTSEVELSTISIKKFIAKDISNKNQKVKT